MKGITSGLHLRVLSATIAILAVMSTSAAAQVGTEESRQREQRVLDRAISCDESAEGIANAAQRFKRKIECYKDYMAAYDADPAVLEVISEYEELYNDALNAKTQQALEHPFQGDYLAWRGYTSKSRPKPDSECLSEYGPFPVTVDEDGVIEIVIENRVLRGVVDKDGNIDVNGQKPGKVKNKKIGLVSGRVFKSRFTINGHLSNASMVSGYCKDGYFRMTKN